MGLTQNDIEMLRERVPEQFRADPARTLNPTFRDADNLTDDGGYRAGLRAEQNEIADAVAQPNEEVLAKRLQAERHMQYANITGEAATITNADVNAAAASQLSLQAQRRKDQEKKGGIDITTQLVLLQQQAEQLQADMRAIEKEVFSKEELAYLDGLPSEERRDAAKDILDQKLANGEITPDQHHRWMEKDREIRANQEKQIAAQERVNDFAARGVDNDDKEAVGAALEASEAYQQQYELTKLQDAIAGVATESRAAEAMQERDAVKTAGFETIEEAVERFMKEAARIEKIEDPKERLIAEKEFVDSVRNLPENMMDAAVEIEFADNTMHMFEEGYFDSLDTQTADAGNATPGSNGDHDINRDSGQGNVPGNGLG